MRFTITGWYDGFAELYDYIDDWMHNHDIRNWESMGVLTEWGDDTYKWYWDGGGLEQGEWVMEDLEDLDSSIVVRRK